MDINPLEINGNWDKGFVLDRHVFSSTPKGENVYGHMEYDTIRTHLGELIFQLKYRNNHENIDTIMELIKPFLDSFSELNEADIVIPVPPTKDRDFQPVDELARAIAMYLNIGFSNKVLEKVEGFQSKNMAKTDKNLEGSIVARTKATRPHTILLVDDLYSSGKTMSECVSVLRADPLLKKIYVLAMTRTR
jgi:predicted amidophosphoribosyltransferase